MPVMTAYKNAMAEAIRNKTAPTIDLKAVGLFTKEAAKAVKTVSGAKLTVTGGAPAVDSIVTFTVLKKGAGFVAERFYYVTASSGTECELGEIKGGEVVTPTTEVEVGSELAVVKEIEYGTGGRSTAVFGAAANGAIKDGTSRSVKPKSGSKVLYISNHSQEAAGGTLASLSAVTEETFSSEGGTYTITSNEISLQGLA